MKDDEKQISGNLSLVKNIGHTYDAGGYLKEASKNMGQASFKLSADDKEYGNIRKAY